jgi:hypothetical protein
LNVYTVSFGKLGHKTLIFNFILEQICLSWWARIRNFFFDIEKYLNAVQEIDSQHKHEHKHNNSEHRSEHRSEYRPEHKSERRPKSNYKSNSRSESNSNSHLKPKPTRKMSYTGPSKHEIYYQIVKYNDAHPYDFIHIDASKVSDVDKAKVKSLESHEKSMRKNYSVLQRATEVFIPKLNKIMEMETNEQAMAMNWDLLIQETDIMVKLLKESKLEIEAELSKLAKEAKAESLKECMESQRGNGRATFSPLGTSSDSHIARELQKQEDEEVFARVKKVRFKISSSSIVHPQQFLNQVSTTLP